MWPHALDARCPRLRRLRLGSEGHRLRVRPGPDHGLMGAHSHATMLPASEASGLASRESQKVSCGWPPGPSGRGPAGCSKNSGCTNLMTPAPACSACGGSEAAEKHSR